MMIKKSSPVNQPVEVGTTLHRCSCCGNPVVGGSAKLGSSGSICTECKLKMTKRTEESDAGTEGR